MDSYRKARNDNITAEATAETTDVEMSETTNDTIDYFGIGYR